MSRATLRLIAEQREADPRRDAAATFREARTRLAAGLDAAEACGWAMVLAPESRAAQRLTIDWLLRSGQIEHAYTLTSAALLRRRDDWRAWMRRAQALLAMDRLAEADDAAARAAQLRPHHRQLALLAADIALQRGDDDRALETLRAARQRHPHDASIARRLIETLLHCGHADEAAAALDQVDDAAAPVELCAAVLAAQGRLLDAQHTLEIALEFAASDAQRQPLLLGLIDVLDQAGDWSALRRLRVRPDVIAASSAVAQRLTEASLTPGDFAHAEMAAGSVDARVSYETSSIGARDKASSAAPAVARVVLAALANRRDEALRLASDLCIQRPASMPPSREANLWLRALLGLTVCEQIDARGARRAGADPAASVLQELLPRAVATLETALAEQAESDDARRRRLMHQACQAAQIHIRRSSPQTAWLAESQASLREEIAHVARQAA